MRKLGWHKQLPDFRDIQYYQSPSKLTLPATVDLRPHMPPVYDQGQLGSCTANAVAGLVEYDRIRQGKPALNPSRLFIYYNERMADGTVTSDAGSTIRESIKSVNDNGWCLESEWPYDESQFAVHPPADAYHHALSHKVKSYQAIPQTEYALQLCLAQGNPITFGISVYSSFMSQDVASTGLVPLPTPGESLEGGHAILICGYNAQERTFLVRNSWGSSWGMNGYCLMPYEYVLDPNLASDFWTIFWAP